MQVLMQFYSRAYTGADTGTPPDPAMFQRIVAAHLDYEREVLRTQAKVIIGQALVPANEALTVRFPGGDPAVDKGPFSPAEEALGGFYLIECADLDAAAALAAQYPMPPGFGSIELRPVIGFDPALRRQVVGDEPNGDD